VQGWTENPRPEMIKNMQNGDLLILDLFSECRPMWGIPSIWKRDKGYEQHNWLFCMLLNFGGNVGLHGRMDQLLDNFYLTKNNPLAVHLKGIGLTMEGAENNPMMFRTDVRTSLATREIHERGMAERLSLCPLWCKRREDRKSMDFACQYHL